MFLRFLSGLMIFSALFLFVQSAPAQVPSVPEGAAGETYYAAFPVQISLDGNFGDWQGISYQTVTAGPLMPADPNAGGSFRFAAAADYDSLFFAIEVTDPHLVKNQHGDEYWLEDSVEIYINASGDLALTSYTPGVVQLNIPAANLDTPANLIIVGTNRERIEARAVVVATAQGYAIEAAVPLRTSVWTINPATGQTIGFQVQLNSASQLDRDMKLSWSSADQVNDQSYSNPSVFGELIFFPTNGQLQPTVAATATALPTTIPPTATPIPPTDVPPTTAPPVTAPETPMHGFTVEGSTIYDPSGNPFVARGVNVSGYNWVWQRPTAPDVNLIVDCWNFNLVRVNNFLFMGQVPWQQYSVNNNLDEIVNAFTGRGIVVVLEAHDRIGSYYQGGDLDTLVNWFTDLATRYRDNPYVWFDIMNEPGGRNGLDANQWVNMHGRVIQAIRDTAQANNIIIVEGAYGGQDAPNASNQPVMDTAILSYADNLLNYGGRSYGNLVFSIHPYDLWNQGDAKMADYFDRVQALGLAMIVGEYAVYTDQDTRPAAESMFNTAVPRGIGRIVWHWDGSDDNDLTTGGGGWQIDDCEQPGNLTWLGEQVWNDNR